MYSYFALYKPYGMLSQFTREGSHLSLADLNFPFPSDVYPLGRLDTDSEGLLLLTNDKRVNAHLLDPEMGHRRKYLVQLEGVIDEPAMDKLRKGITLNDKGKKYTSLPTEVSRVDIEIQDRNPPIRFRKNIPTCWIEISLTEGKNRQVRKMTAATGFPTLRLIRTEIERITLEKMETGWIKSFNKNDFYYSLKLEQ